MTRDNQNRRAAVAAWTESLGPDLVTTDPRVLGELLDNTSGFPPVDVVAALNPRSVEHVVELVGVARAQRVPLYPFSTGKNWGLGSRLPPGAGCALVDLGGLNRIREVDERYHYAIVEPGVTQGQLAEHLGARGFPLLLNVTGSSPRSSVVGNVLERGTGFRTQRTEDLRGVEVVLGSGTLLRTGFWPDGEVLRPIHHYKFGIGPYLDGLFTQSNFGLVTAIVTNLLTVQEEMRMAMFSFSDHRLSPVIDSLSAMFADGVLRWIVHVFNDKRILTMTNQTATPTWTGLVAIDGPSAQVEATLAETRRRFESCEATVTFYSAKDATRPDLDPMIQGLYRFHAGQPGDLFMRGLYRSLGDLEDIEDPDDLDHSRYGMLACLPVLPMEGDVVVDAVNLIEHVCQRHDLVPAVALNPLDAHGLECVTNIYFDRARPADVARAHACSGELHSTLYEEGFRFYRVDVENMRYLTAQSSSFWEVTAALKRSLDPDGVIAPGRYSTD